MQVGGADAPPKAPVKYWLDKHDRTKDKDRLDLATLSVDWLPLQSTAA